MHYKLELEGFEGQDIEVVPPGFFSSARLMVNGEPAPKYGLTGTMVLIRNDTTAVEAKWVPAALGLDTPLLSVDGKIIAFSEPLKWYSWAWASWSLVVLIIVGNVLGMLVGLIAVLFNVQTLRSGLPLWVRYIVVGAISLLALLVYRSIALELARLGLP
jgi:hypothetical protein